MVKPVFYGIGVGPGESGLLTVEGAKVLEKVSTVFVPMGRDNKPGIAYEIARDYIRLDTPVVALKFPMIGISENEESLKTRWEENATRIEMALVSGDAAFLTLGDPFLYSTYSYIIEYLKKSEMDFEIVTIPGITAFSALSARLSVPLALGEETLCICSLTVPEWQIRENIKNNQNIIIMKASGKNAFLADLIEEYNLEDHFCMLSNIGLDDEKISTRLEDLRGKIPYLTTILIKKDYDFGIRDSGQ